MYSMVRTFSRRQALSLLGAASLCGCSRSRSKELERSFTDGPAQWSGASLSVPDGAWPMIDRTTEGTASTPASGPTDFPLELSWSVSHEGSNTRPIVRQDTLYLSGGHDHGTLEAIAAADGRPKWSIERQTLIDAPPAVARGLVFAPFHPQDGSDTGEMLAFERANGAERWLSETHPPFGTVVLTDSSVLTTGAPGRLLAFDQRSGDLAWAFQPGGLNHYIRGIAVSDTVYFTTGGSTSDYPNAGFVHAFDPDAGELVWSQEFDKPVNDVAVVEETVVAVSETAVAAFDTENGSEQWRHTESVADVLYAEALAIGDGVAVVATEDALVGYDLKNGSRRWKAPGPGYAKVAIADEVVYASWGSEEGPGVTAHALRSGDQLWETGGNMWTAPTIANGRLFVVSDAGELLTWE